MYEYLYYGFDRVAITELESRLSLRGITNIELRNNGTLASGYSVVQSAKRAVISGIILTPDEYDKCAPKVERAKLSDKVHALSDFEALVAFFEREHDLDLSLEPVVLDEPLNEDLGVSAHVSAHSVSDGVEGAQEASSPVSEPVSSVSQPVSTPLSGSSSTSLISATTHPSGLSDEVIDPKEGGLTYLAYEEALKENRLLRDKIATLEVSSSNDVLSLRDESTQALVDENKTLTTRVNELVKDLSSAQSKVSTLEVGYQKYKDLSNDLNNTIAKQSMKLSQLSYQLEEARKGVKEALPSIKVPARVSFYATASYLSVPLSYKHLICNSPDTLLVDLSRESILDSLVRLNTAPRVTKWLLEGRDVRALYASYDQLTILPSQNLSIVASPAVILPETLFEDIDWESILGSLADKNMNVKFYLGLEDSQGVSELIDRMEKPVKVLVGESVLDKRAWNKIKDKHENNVEEVLI